MAFVEELVLAAFMALIVGIIIYFVLAGRIKTIQTKVEHWTDWLRTSDTATLRQEFQKFGEDILS